MATVPEPPPRFDGDTRTRLLRAAAHLFARQGIDGVRIHEIHALAGQRNESAVHYHFGSRWKLVFAILEESDLAAAEALGREAADIDDPESIVTFIAHRLALGLHTPEGRDWLRIVAELMIRFPDRGRGTGVTGKHAEVAERLRGRLPGVPDDYVERRTVSVLQFMTSQTAERARHIDDGHSGLPDEDEFLDELVTMSLGALTAPARRGR